MNGGGSDALRWSELGRLVGRIAGLEGCDAHLTERAERLAERIRSRRFHIAVLGEFKRGKSTLVNALIGKSVLPSGSLPLTSVATEVHIGPPHVAVIFDDGREIATGPEAIKRYATEEGNPSNHLGVRRVEVGVDTSFGVGGLVMVDTPGVASIHEHNTAAAHDALLDSDAAVLVLSADSPLSESERELLRQLHERESQVFLVINKADHLSRQDLDQVRQFVAGQASRIFGTTIEPYCVSAKAALERLPGLSPEVASEFRSFREHLDRFVRTDLDGARRSAAIGELRRLAGDLASSLQIEEAAMAMDLQTLTDRLDRFGSAAIEGHRLLAEDRMVLDHEVGQLSESIGRELAEGGARAAQAAAPRLAAMASELPVRHLDTGLRECIEQLVTEGFDPVWLAAQSHAEHEWDDLAERFAQRIEKRIAELRAIADRLFDVQLVAPHVSGVAGQRPRFSYLFLHVEGPNAVIGRIARIALPPALARHRALQRAQRKLLEEFDKHAGRARYDLTERLRSAEGTFVRELVREFEEVQTSISAAASRAKEGVDLAVDLRDERRRFVDDAKEIIDEVAGL
ncbi:MAG: dynamin family protein [Acidimicrobiales bacterium]